MEEGVLLLMCAIVLQTGEERYALNVRLVEVVLVWAKHNYLLVHSAICEDDFCLNGGNCSYPNSRCSCTADWAGHRCEMGKKIMCMKLNYLLYEGTVFITSNL